LKHFSDPVLSRIQASIEAQLRAQSGEVDAAGSGEEMCNNLALHPRTVAVAHLCSEYAQGRKSRLDRFSYEERTIPLKHLDPHAECLDLYCRLAMSRLYGDMKRYDALANEFKFSSCDPEWFEAIEKYFENFGLDHSHQDIPYVNYRSLSDFVCEGLPDDLSIGILGDWGTGQSIAVDQLKSLVEKEPDLIIHLGDVYYAGTEDEYDNKLKALIDNYAKDKSGNPIPFLNMPGNHDMYAGGQAFYNAFAWQNRRNASSKLPMIEQNASYFCLKSISLDWQILAMDTSYHDHNPFLVDSGMTRVREREVEWALEKINGFPGQTILLSHHQPFSPYEEIGSMELKKPTDYYKNPHLLALHERLQSESQSGVCLWIWGHEHNLCIYSPFAGIEHGRCVGHSAVPVLSEMNPYATRHMTIRDAVASLAGSIKGVWGTQRKSQLIALWTLLFNKQRVATPQLVSKDGKPLTLTKTRDGNMYQHGYSVMRFGQLADVGKLSVDYYAGDSRTPFFSENIAANRPEC